MSNLPDPNGTTNQPAPPAAVEPVKAEPAKGDVVVDPADPFASLTKEQAVEVARQNARMAAELRRDLKGAQEALVGAQGTLSEKEKAEMQAKGNLQELVDRERAERAADRDNARRAVAMQNLTSIARAAGIVDDSVIGQISVSLDWVGNDYTPNVDAIRQAVDGHRAAHPNLYNQRKATEPAVDTAPPVVPPVQNEPNPEKDYSTLTNAEMAQEVRRVMGEAARMSGGGTIPMPSRR